MEEVEAVIRLLILRWARSKYLLVSRAGTLIRRLRASRGVLTPSDPHRPVLP